MRRVCATATRQVEDFLVRVLSPDCVVPAVCVRAPLSETYKANALAGGVIADDGNRDSHSSSGKVPDDRTSAPGDGENPLPPSQLGSATPAAGDTPTTTAAAAAQQPQLAAKPAQPPGAAQDAAGASEWAGRPSLYDLQDHSFRGGHGDDHSGDSDGDESISRSIVSSITGSRVLAGTEDEREAAYMSLRAQFTGGGKTTTGGRRSGRGSTPSTRSSSASTGPRRRTGSSKSLLTVQSVAGVGGGGGGGGGRASYTGTGAMGRNGHDAGYDAGYAPSRSRGHSVGRGTSGSFGANDENANVVQTPGGSSNGKTSTGRRRGGAGLPRVASLPPRRSVTPSSGSESARRTRSPTAEENEIFDRLYTVRHMRVCWCVYGVFTVWLWLWLCGGVWRCVVVWVLCGCVGSVRLSYL